MRHNTAVTIFLVIFLLAGAKGLQAQEPEQKFNGFNLQGYDDSGANANKPHTRLVDWCCMHFLNSPIRGIIQPAFLGKPK